MVNRRDILCFGARFLVLFGLLIFPWPHFQESFATGYRYGVQALVRLSCPHSLVTVQPYCEPGHHSVDTKISLADPDAPRMDGLLPVKIFTLDSRSLGWMPMAMFLALWGATPLKWPHHWKMFLVGLAINCLFLAATILASMGPAMCSNGWKHFLAVAARHVLVDNLWLSFVGPMLIWLGCLIWHYPTSAKEAGEAKQIAV